MEGMPSDLPKLDNQVCGTISRAVPGPRKYQCHADVIPDAVDLQLSNSPEERLMWLQRGVVSDKQMGQFHSVVSRNHSVG